MKVLLRFSSDIIQEPIIADTILTTGAKINIARANVGATTGEIVIDVPGEYCQDVVHNLEKHGVDLSLLESPVVRDDEECVHCGACVSICPLDVFQFNDDWIVEVDEERCIQCGSCVEGCPHQALTLA